MGTGRTANTVNLILELCEQVMSKNEVFIYCTVVIGQNYPSHYAWRNLEEETNGDGKELGERAGVGGGITSPS